MSLDYGSYLQLDKLLSLQRPRSEPPEHDETLFIVIHQAYELWFKQLLHEFDHLKPLLSGGELFEAIATLKRVRMIMKTVVQMVDILETMTPLSFASFRDRLERASGLQSYQFRELECVLGQKRPDIHERFAEGSPERAAVERRLRERSIVDHLYDLLERHGAAIPDELRAKPPEAPTQPHPAVQEALARLYRESGALAILLEEMTDFDEGFQEWRYRHVKLVERTIGDRRGTGGSSGVAYLKRALFRPVFPDLWAVRSRF